MLADGVSKDITPQEGSKNSFWGWSRDDQNLYIKSNARDARFFDLLKKSISSLHEEVAIGETIYQNDNGFELQAISDNERYLAVSQALTTSSSKMYLIDRETGNSLEVSEGDKALYVPQYFGLDNQSLYYLTNKDREFTVLMKYDIPSKEHMVVYETNWDVDYAFESYNEKYRVIGVNEEALTAIHVFDIASGTEVELPDMPGRSIRAASISRSEKLMRLTIGSSFGTDDLFVFNFESGELTQLTNTLNPDINSEHLVDAEHVYYKSFDGTEIPAVYYQPKMASSENQVPALVWVHGGPGGQSKRNYRELIQYLVNHGYAILAVNNRGSSGYGKTFNRMDDRNHGEGDLQDCVWGKKFFESTGVVDMERIGIIGGSYGGYMVMAALTYTPEEFNVGVNIFGVTNWLRTLKSIPPHWESFREALYEELGDPYTEDSVRLRKISPLFHTENVTKPLMVLQGANDVRVLQVESDEIVDGVKANGVPVEYIIFDDEGHGFLKKENELEGYGKIKVFLDRHLKGEGEVTAEVIQESPLFL
ncbi:MAG: alpha/beta fold hydrolase [Cyclobacteriaceae bacterium]